MAEIKFRDYQDDIYTEIELNADVKKLLVFAPCGAGKSVLIGKLANDLSKSGRVLVLTHRVELLNQNSDWLERPAIVSSGINTMRYDTKIVIAMVETASARLKKFGIKYLGDFKYIIVDEAHIDIFKKVYSKFHYERLIGFTASPLTNKVETKEVDGIKYTRPLTMANEYDKLIGSVSEKQLIEKGFLCQDFNVVLRVPGIEKLKESESDPDGYTRASINEVYNNTASFEILMEAYNRYCKGKKTMIFNANSKINLSVYEYFFKLGVECRMYDSVNSTGVKRKEVVEWYENTPGAVLINANVFTTGFNVPDTECIIFNRATKSLTLWLQAIGRGARTTNKIYKDMFTVVDLGENIYEHGTFSQERNWQNFFQPSAWKRKKVMDLLKTWSCTFCEAINVIGEEECCICGMPKEDVVVIENNKKERIGEFEALTEMPLPKAQTIINYALQNGKDGNFAFKVLEERILELFIHYNVSAGFYIKKKAEFRIRIRQIYTPIYFGIMKSKQIHSSRKKLDTQMEKMFAKIDKHYRC
jgi:superfamily II DNA or RNA helicase